MPHLGLLSERVKIVEYDPCWPGLFASEAVRIQAACAGRLSGVEHVGSTAVQGLAAKPILDVMLGVPDFADARACVPLIESLGYVFLGTYGIEGRFFFRSPEPCTHHLHLVEKDGKFWQDEILFRNYLRNHPRAGLAYVELKRELAEKFAANRPAYTEAKGEFIGVCLSNARSAIHEARE